MSDDRAEQIARQRFAWLQAVRIASIFAVILGIAIARDLVPAPYLIGVTLALGGLVSFFFGPPLLARRFKRHDAGER